MTREQPPAGRSDTTKSQVQSSSGEMLDAIEEEQQLFPVYALDIAEEPTRPLAIETGEKEAVSLRGIKGEITPAPPTPFLGLPEEQTPWPPVLRLAEAEEKLSRPPILSAPANVVPTPLEYVLEVAQKTTQFLPQLRPLRKVPRQLRQVLLACVSGLLVVLLVAISALALRGGQSQQQQQHAAATHAPQHSTATGQKATPALPTSVPTSAPPVQPVQPFPSALGAQIAALEAHDRFFYNGNTSLPEIALTFDDGPNPAYTPQVLAILKRYHVNATFFDIGRLVRTYPALVRQELQGGNDIGNHTWTHPDMRLLTQKEMKAQIQQTSDAIVKAIGVRPIYMRPPYGAISASVLPVINNLGLTTVVWNDEARDWSLPGTSVIVARILNLARDGAIILLHDGGGMRAQTVQALPTIIQRLRARGYTFVTMDELVAHIHKHRQGATPVPTPTPGRSVTVTPAPEGFWGEPGTLQPWWEMFEREKKTGGCGC